MTDYNEEYTKNEQYYIDHAKEINAKHKGKIVFIVSEDIVATVDYNDPDDFTEAERVMTSFNEKEKRYVFTKGVSKCATCEEGCVIIITPIGLLTDDKRKELLNSKCKYRR